MLNGKSAVVYGAAGHVGAPVARAFAAAGARVFLAGRTREPLEAVARDITQAGGSAEVAVMDALDEAAVESHLDAVVQAAGRIDVSVNAVSIRGELQGVPLTVTTVEDYLAPIETGTRTTFLTARAAARRMAENGSGAILLISTSAAGLTGPIMGGFGVACAAIEAFGRQLAGEVSPRGVRVLTIRSEGFPETWPDEFRTHVLDSATDATHGDGMSRAEFQPRLEGLTLLRRLPTLAEFAQTATFLASDHAGAMTGVVVDMTCGATA
jgi:NAD(P)-dependent dehydrogenase (short-subunit alcohol dehydrogenase family)